MEIVLYQPQIPQNTGNIIRTCAVTGTDLVLVEPLGFSLQDRWLKRAGLDYLEDVHVRIIPSLEDYIFHVKSPFTFFSSHASKKYSDNSYPSDHILIFGSEDQGLPQNFWDQWPEHFSTIPMRESSRCLNLSTSVAIVLYEGLRQNKFPF